MLRFDLVERFANHLVSFKNLVVSYPVQPLISIVPLHLGEAGLNGVAVGLVGQVEDRNDL